MGLYDTPVNFGPDFIAPSIAGIVFEQEKFSAVRFFGCAFHLPANSDCASAKLARIAMPENVPAVGLDDGSQGKNVLTAGAGPAHPATTQSLLGQYLTA